MANTKFDEVAIGDIGTQLFHFDSGTFKYLDCCGWYRYIISCLLK